MVDAGVKVLLRQLRNVCHQPIFPVQKTSNIILLINFVTEWSPLTKRENIANVIDHCNSLESLISIVRLLSLRKLMPYPKANFKIGKK